MRESHKFAKFGEAKRRMNMKTRILTILAVLLLSVSAFAQSESTLKGDVNEDGKKSIVDVTTLINMLLSGN